MSLYDKMSIGFGSGFGYKAGILYNLKPTDGTGDFTIDRNSTATQINSDGLIESVAIDVPRTNYPLNGGCPSLLIEPESTNLTLRSEEFDNAYWSKSNSSISVNETTSPDATTTADKIIENSGSGSKSVIANINTSIGLEYTWSVFIKADARSKARLNIFGAYAEFDIHNQTLITQNGITSYNIEDYGNGWGRFSITETANSSSTLAYVYLLDDAGDVSYTGDGVSGFYLWGAQLEGLSYNTSYIPTTTATVTRNADLINNAGDSGDFNSLEGVLYAEMSALSDDLTNREISISDGTTSERVTIRYSTTTNTINAVSSVGGVLQSSLTFSVTDITVFTKIAFKYKTNDFALWVNGVEVDTSSSGITPLLNTLNDVSFDNGAGGVDFYGECKELAVFNEALSDNELIKLTT